MVIHSYNSALLHRFMAEGIFHRSLVMKLTFCNQTYRSLLLKITYLL